MDKREVVLSWLLRGIEDFFVAFDKFDEPFSRYAPFFNAMGFEMISKAYLLATRASEYVGLDRNEGVRKIDEIARDMGHKVKRLAEELKQVMGHGGVQQVLDQKFDGFTGSQFLDVIEAAYLESRYLVPNPIHQKFPLDKEKHQKFSLARDKRLYWDPLNSSGLHKFCYAFCREILASLKADFGISLTESLLKDRLRGEAGARFCNLLFDGRMGDFVSK